MIEMVKTVSLLLIYLFNSGPTQELDSSKTRQSHVVTPEPAMSSLADFFPADSVGLFDFRPAPLDMSPLMGIDGALCAFLNKLFEDE